MLIGIAYFFIGWLDLLHTLSFRGMQIFKDPAFYTTQFWIAGRFVEAVTLLMSFWMITHTKKFNPYKVFVMYCGVTVFLVASILYWKVFPDCFIAGAGLTPFKIYSEYVICLILMLALLLLHTQKGAFEKVVYKYLLASIVCTILSELAFTIYVDNYDALNQLGHYLKIFSFYFIYRAIVVKAIREPHEIIFREIKQNECQLAEQNLLLKGQATTDPLTGLSNHRAIYDRLEAEADRYHNTHSPFVVMMLDIDHFKTINDTYGHLTGDNVLRHLAQILCGNIRPTDLAGRYGGEEFLLLLTDTNADTGYSAAEKLRQVIESTSFDKQIRVTVSIGVKEYSGESITSLLEGADKKLYQAKETGRNRTVQ